MKHNKNILYFSFVDWYWIKQRPQHFSELLSKNNHVTYLSIVSWRKGKNIASSHTKKNEHINSKKFYKNPNLLVIRKKIIPKANKISIIQNINKNIMKKLLHQLDIDNNYDIICLTHPLQIEYLPNHFWKSKKVIYDCMDNYKEFPYVNKEKIIRCEETLVSKADIIFSSSDDLYFELIKKYDVKDKLHVINNGVDIDIFDLNKINYDNELDIIKENNKKKVAYIGTVSEWLDIDIIYKCAKKNNEIDFYIIGPIDIKLDISKWENISNLIFTGSQPYYSIPNILNKVDVAIMTFKMNELVLSVNPVKVYEYLAMGKLVLANRYKETQKFGNLIETYNDSSDFETTLLSLLEINQSPEDIDKKINYARENSWWVRVNLLEEIIEKNFEY